jgi:hypothetical protein
MPDLSISTDGDNIVGRYEHGDVLQCVWRHRMRGSLWVRVFVIGSRKLSALIVLLQSLVALEPRLLNNICGHLVIE